MTKKAPGKSFRNGISLIDAVKMFDSESKAEQWFIENRWNGDVRCPHCDTDNIRRNDNVRMSMRFFCRPCRRYFSVKVGTVMHDSKLPLSKWGLAIFLMNTNLKGVSSLKLHRDLDIAQKNAWHMLHRLRAGFEGNMPEKFGGPVQVDEAHIGGKSKSMSHGRRAKMRDMGLLGGGARGKTHVVGMRDQETGMVRAEVVPDIKADTLQKFVLEHTNPDTVVYTDESTSYNHLPRPHGRVNHKAKQYVDGEKTTNGIESLWATTKRGIHGTYHNISPKHAQRYVDEFTGRHNVRPLDTEDQMGEVVKGMEGKRVRFDELTAYTGENRYTVIVE